MGKIVQQAGFTLIEVMVALAVVAIALSALSQASGNFIWNQVALEQRVVGNWVAQNELNQLQVGLLKQPRLQAKVQQMGHEWQLKTHTQATPVPGMVKLNIEILTEQQPVANLTTVWAQQGS